MSISFPDIVTPLAEIILVDGAYAYKYAIVGQRPKSDSNFLRVLYTRGRWRQRSYGRYFLTSVRGQTFRVDRKRQRGVLAGSFWAGKPSETPKP